MKEQADKNIERLVDKIMNDASVETPSFNFTESVMSQVNALQNSDITVYKPLISKTTWMFIVFGFLALIGYFIFGAETEGTSWFSAIDFSVLSNNRLLEAIPSFELPKTVLYAVVLFAFMLCIQIPVLKNHFDKRFEI